MTTAQHTVEKIGGTSMSNYEAVRDNIIIGKRKKSDLYQRIFVVSAYGGVTNELLEHKKTGEPGVYALFADAESDWAWGDDLTKLIQLLTDINGELFADPMLKQQADQFITDRIEGVRGCLIDLQRLCSYGQFQLEEHLLTVREMLAGIGEAHSAFNTALKLQQEGINARFVDLTGWRDSELLPLDEKLKQAFDAIDLSRELPIVTGYAQCKEGLMRTFDRGYSEMTFSRTAVITNAREAIIHKEYHLSSADPNIVGEDKVVPLGRTNYDVADQLANLGMEAIHPRAASGLRKKNILLRVKNTFEPEHSGTVIHNDYCSQTPKVEIIAGARNVWALEIFDQDMVGDALYAQRMNDLVLESGVRVLTKDFNANTVTHYLKGNKRRINWLMDRLQGAYPDADIRVEKLAMVSAIGSDLKIPGLLQKAAGALSSAGVNIQSVHQAMRQVDMMFLVSDADYGKAVKALHEQLIEQSASWTDQQTA